MHLNQTFTLTLSDGLFMQGTLHLVDAAKKAGVKKFVLMSSLLTNGREAGQGTNPNFIVLNLFGGVLDQKLKVWPGVVWHVNGRNCFTESWKLKVHSVVKQRSSHATVLTSHNQDH